jgi:hypothetical protein
MEALKSDYFEAVCLLVCEDNLSADFGIEDLGLGPALCDAIQWYQNGPIFYQDILRKTLMKEVLDAKLRQRCV